MHFHQAKQQILTNIKKENQQKIMSTFVKNASRARFRRITAQTMTTMPIIQRTINAITPIEMPFSEKNHCR